MQEALLQQCVLGAKFENGVLVERPNESASGDTHAHDALIHRPWLFLSGRAAVPLIVICQCAVVRRVVAP